MQIQIEQNQIRKSTILRKIIYALIGVFIACTMLGINTQLFKETGIITGLVLDFVLGAFGFYYTKKGEALRLISWSIIITTITIMTIGISILHVLEKNLENL